MTLVAFLMEKALGLKSHLFLEHKCIYKKYKLMCCATRHISPKIVLCEKQMSAFLVSDGTTCLVQDDCVHTKLI